MTSKPNHVAFSFSGAKLQASFSFMDDTVIQGDELSSAMIFHWQLFLAKSNLFFGTWKWKEWLLFGNVIRASRRSWFAIRWCTTCGRHINWELHAIWIQLLYTLQTYKKFVHLINRDVVVTLFTPPGYSWKYNC